MTPHVLVQAKAALPRGGHVGETTPRHEAASPPLGPIPGTRWGRGEVGVHPHLRQGEAFGVTLDRIDFLRRTLRVDRQLVGSHQGRPVFGPPKTAASVRHPAGTGGRRGAGRAHPSARHRPGRTPVRRYQRGGPAPGLVLPRRLAARGADRRGRASGHRHAFGVVPAVDVGEQCPRLLCGSAKRRWAERGAESRARSMGVSDRAVTPAAALHVSPPRGGSGDRGAARGIEPPDQRITRTPRTPLTVHLVRTESIHARHQSQQAGSR